MWEDNRRRTLSLEEALLWIVDSYLVRSSDLNLECLKGLVHPKMKIVINYSPSCRSKPVRPSFIFGTQIKMFFMKSESYQTLHRQQCNWNVPRSRNVVNTSVKQSMWHQWLNFSFATLREYFFLRKENKNNNLLNHSSPPSYVVRHFREYHNAYYARFPLSVNNDTQIVHARAFPPNIFRHFGEYPRTHLTYSALFT